jgi:hypothetical protein
MRYAEENSRMRVRDLELLVGAVEAYENDSASAKARDAIEMYRKKMYSFFEAEDRLRSYVQKLASGVEL